MDMESGGCKMLSDKTTNYPEPSMQVLPNSPEFATKNSETSQLSTYF
jgi:hypothetical protein